jgi:hypothetical protein
MTNKSNARDERTPTPRPSSLHDVRRVVSLKKTKQCHSQESDPPTNAQRKIRYPNDMCQSSPSSIIAPLRSPARKLQNNVNDSSSDPKRNQRNANAFAENPLVQRHGNQEADQCQKQREARDDERPADFDLVGFVSELRARMFVLVMVGASHEDVRAGQADAEEDVQHGSAEAG